MRHFLIFFTAIFICAQGVNAAAIEDKKELVITTLDGQKFDLKDFQGKNIIINFWAEWCINCVHEMAILQELYLAYPRTDLEIIGVSIDPKKFTKNVRSRTAKVTYPNAMLIDATANNFLEIRSLPTSYVIDKNGKVTVLKGDHPKQDFEELLRYETVAN